MNAEPSIQLTHANYTGDRITANILKDASYESNYKHVGRSRNLSEAAGLMNNFLHIITREILSSHECRFAQI